MRRKERELGGPDSRSRGRVPRSGKGRVPRSGKAGVPRSGGGGAAKEAGKRLPSPQRFGCGVIRRYGLSAFQPFGNFFFISSGSVSDGTMTQSSPSFQSAGVATWW
jgi:hypothetical protein